MFSLVVALALAGAPKPLTRAELLQVMEQKPTASCGTGNPWLLFVDDEHARSTNKLLIMMVDDASLTQDQRDDANETTRRVLEEFTVGPKLDVAALEKKLFR